MTVADRVLAETIAETAARRNMTAGQLARMSDEMWAALAFESGVTIPLPIASDDARLLGSVVDLVLAGEEAEQVAHL